MLFFENPIDSSDTLRAKLTSYYYRDETECVEALIGHLNLTPALEQKIQALATQFVEKARESIANKGGIEAFMTHYDLSTEEGIMLMCLAEALLRVPDKETENLLIRDKLTGANWQQHVGKSASSFVNMATWGLVLTGKILKNSAKSGYFLKLWKNLVRRSGEPIIRQAVREAIKIMSQQFVLGATIEEALTRAQDMMAKGYCYSYDMLGEVARTQPDADKYFIAYQQAITAIAQTTDLQADLLNNPSISIKLSALYPRYEFNQHEKAIPILIEKLKTLALTAKQAHISVTIDAEEADRLEMSLDIFYAVLCDDALKNWHGLGLAVQAYQKRAYPLLQWLIATGKRLNKRIPVRLVKGAYWDSEIKLAQVQGHPAYPVFTRKVSTDISYLACAKLMLSASDTIYSQFATHNAYSVATILTFLDGGHSQHNFEFQNLQGMGKELHDQIVLPQELNLPCRIYAPVGSYQDLLPYLVRRLLENGANSSFVNKISNKKIPASQLAINPVQALKRHLHVPNHRIPLPEDIYGTQRKNSNGVNFSYYSQLNGLSERMEMALQKHYTATPGHRKISLEEASSVASPIDGKAIGQLMEANSEDVEQAIIDGLAVFPVWNAIKVSERADIIRKLADLLEEHQAELIVLAAREAGKTLANAVNEIREAVDFCRYYAALAEEIMAPKELPGPTGELNIFRLYGRGVMVSISPWNFPIAIFTGQMVAALVTGNCVLAKPAEQTPLTAALVVELAYKAGIPKSVLQLLPGRGEVIGAKLTEDVRIAGVLFTGSTQTAKAIQRALGKDPNRPIIPLIAETGGINALIADSTALPEQLVMDVINSAFDSAGQRCSALRLLFIQEDIADHVLTMLRGAMEQLTIGDPIRLSTDIGPVIDKEAQAMLEAYAQTMAIQAKLIYRVALPANLPPGTFVAPQAYELPDISLLKREVFGPILHVVRYKADNLDKVISDINNLGYGLTFGIQSRINETIDYIQSRIKVGNIYVNRNMIGAVVGVQPFGGCHLSGTGPKAGGPYYLLRLCEENTLSINTTAAGGNASLIALGDD